jgi:hypothetical protein
MGTLNKIIYSVMLGISLFSITFNIITHNYHYAMASFTTLCWVGVAWTNEKRCINLKKQIDDLNGTN